jgi:hypothetical protein
MSGVVFEFRVHGVSGTPPEEMIGPEVEPDLDRLPPGGAAPDVWRPVDQMAGVRAFRWSSLTSGRPITAVWLVLLPYMLANLAGWALPPGDGIRHRLATSVVRLAGLALTAIFAMIAAVGFVGVGAVQVLGGELGGWAIPVGMAASVALVLVLWVVAAVPQGDPLTDRPHLRTTHVAIALWAIWWVGSAAVVERGHPGAGSPVPVSAAWLIPLLATAITLVRDVTEQRRTLIDWIERGLLTATAGLAGWEALAAATGPAISSTTPLVTIDDRLRDVVAAFAVLTALAALLSVSRTAPRAVAVVTALLALAGSTGAAIGAAIIDVSARVTGAAAPSGISVVAESFFTGMLAVLVVLAVLTAASTSREQELTRSLARTGVTIRNRMTWLLAAIGVVTLSVLAATFERLDGPEGGSGFGSASGVLLALALGGAAIAAFRMGAPRAGAVLSAVALSVPLWWSRIPFTGTAIAVTLFLPLALVATRIVGAIGDRDRRRALAVPWDVGSFFGRRYHPFAPPSYGEAARTRLAAAIEGLPAEATVILGGHSQGSVVAAVATDLISREVRLISYGSPIGSLYARFFPRSFGPARWAGICERAGGRWVNLWRNTDPVAGPIGGGVDDRLVADPHLRIHARYWAGDEDDYARAVADLTRRTFDGETP